MAAVPYIWFRGKRMTPAFRDAILAAEGRAGFTFTITQGGFNAGGVAASAGTHDGDAADFSVRGLAEARIAATIEALRWAGIAAWLRTTNTSLHGVRPQGFGSAHIHAVPNGWGAPSRGARDQAVAYRRGRDGLARNLADIGPGHTSAWRNRTTPGKPTNPGLPGAGATGPAPTPKPKEDTLSAAEEARIIAHVDAKFRDLQVKGLDRTGFDPIVKAVKDWPVYRGGRAVPWIQDTANATSNTQLLLGRVDGLTKAVQDLASGQGVDGAAIADAAKAGALAGVAEGTTDIAETVRAVVSDALKDLARDLDEDTVNRIADFVRVDLAARLTEGDAE